MQKAKLKELMEENLMKAKELLLKDGYVAPMGFIFSPTGIGICPLRFRDNKEKILQLLGLKGVAQAKKADAIFIIIESWYVKRKIENIQEAEEENIIPSRQPDREECIIVMGECKEGNIGILQRFKREGKKIIFEEKVEMEEMISPLFTNFGIKEEERIKGNPMYG